MYCCKIVGMAGTVAVVMLLMVVGGSQGLADCLYQFIQQPHPSLSCDPHGTQLQLHCAFTGPLSPPFSISWYSTTTQSPSELSPLTEDYAVKNIVMDMTAGKKMRSISSILQTVEIGEDEVGSCYLCSVEFFDLAILVTSTALCIGEQSTYTNKPRCEETTSLVDTAPRCVNITGEDIVQLQMQVTTPTNTSSPAPTIDPNSTNTSTGGSLHTSTTVAKTTADSVTPTPAVGDGATKSPQNSDPVTAEGDMEQEPNIEGALYAAIVVCVLFVVVILVLIVIIVCMMRRKCGCLGRWSLLGQKDRTKGGDGDRSAFMNGGNMQSSVEYGLSTSTTVIHGDDIDGPRLIVASIEQDPRVHSSHRMQHVNRAFRGHSEAKSDASDHSAPDLPPKSGKLVEKETTHHSHRAAGGASYDHLDTIKKMSPDPPHQQASPKHSRSEQPTKTTEKPPKKPPRSRSREHFYHTLESSDESGLLRSANTSHHSSMTVGLSSHQASDHEDEGDYAEPFQENSGRLSAQLKELFDDPRYAVLFVNMRDGEKLGSLSNRKDLCRSTPSLTTNVQPLESGVPERRSLRTSHKRISVLPDPHVHK